MRESYVEKQVCKFAQTLGWQYRKQNGTGQRGKFDRYFIRDREQIVFVEFKASGKEASALQEFEQLQIQSMGFTAVIIDNIEDGENFFKGLEDESE